MRLAFLLTLLALAPMLLATEPELDFNRDIRPILAENCFYCHGQDGNKRQGDLRLDDRDAAMAMQALVPGQPEASGIIERIHSTDAELLMPPAKSNRRLTDDQKKILETWIKQGAKYSAHWAFIAPIRPSEPSVTDAAWVRNPIDKFVLAKLESMNWKPSPTADPATLVKRLYVDLIGLPPPQEEIDRFVADPSDQAYEALVDRLLASEHYGERMSLPWLDAARYADSNGFQQDGDTWQWMWRDWVIDALNADLPFDQFSIWQLAGDLLPDATTEQKIASGFNRNHLLNGEGGAIAEEQRFVILFDRIDTTATNWLGLTMACAQCHDHKYDPLTMRDYYSLMDAFNRVPESGVPNYYSSRIRVAPPLIELPTEENKKKIAEYETEIAKADAEAAPLVDIAFEGWRIGLMADGKAAEGNGLSDALANLLRKPEGERNEDDKRAIESELRKHFDEKVRGQFAAKIPAMQRASDLRGQLNSYRSDQIPRVMVMSDDQPRETFMLERGEYLKPKEKVTFAVPAFLPAMPEDFPRNRLGFAKWLFLPEHPLTARVQVNRMWQYFFGSGIIKTAEDFGVQSEYPLHGALLDWLAVEFREKGWSVKTMHKLIVMSATYRQSSRMTEEHRTHDAENRLFSRASRFRMPSLVLRDWALASAELLNTRLHGAPVYPYQPDAVWESLAITKERDFTYPASSGSDLYRRSVYTFWRRTVGPANMFDASNRQTCRVRASTTSTPLHALTTLNDPTWVEAAREMAEKLIHSCNDSDQRLVLAFRRVLCREPKSHELDLLKNALEKQRQAFRSDATGAKEFVTIGAKSRDESIDVVEHAAFASVCLGIMNLDEALSRE